MILDDCIRSNYVSTLAYETYIANYRAYEWPVISIWLTKSNLIS